MFPDHTFFYLFLQEEMKQHVAATEAKCNKMEIEVAVLRDTTDEAVVEKEIAEEYSRDLEEKLATITDQYNSTFVCVIICLCQVH